MTVKLVVPHLYFHSKSMKDILPVRCSFIMYGTSYPQ